MDDMMTGRAGRVLWGLAGALLLLVWVAAMSLDDDRLCSSVPLSFGLAAVLVLGGAGMVAGARPARPTLTCLFGLSAGLYFLIRCLAGDMLSEIWRELPLILAAFVFYGCGYLMAQRRGGGALTLALSVAVLVNVAYLILLRFTEMPLEATGRPSMSLAGANIRHETLFPYCNFAASFLMVAGGVLICRPFWAGWKNWGDYAGGFAGMVGVAASCLCGSRSVLALPALMLVSAWVLWAIIRLYSGKGIGWGVSLSGLALLLGGLVALVELFLGHSLAQQLLSVDSSGRFALWGQVCRILPQIPWCGHGAGAVTWQLVPMIDSAQVPNYAHNDYLQAWVDYGLVGVLLLLAVLVSHLAAGFWSLASEDVDRERRALVASCLLLLLSLAGCAVFEFVWHNVALVGMTAFACGVLASPVPCRREPLFGHRRWAPGHRPALRPVRPMGWVGVSLCCLGGLALAAGCGGFGWRLLPAWQAQWEYNALCQAGAGHGERVEFLERVMPFYPDPELVDHYVTLWPPAGRTDNLAREEQMMRLALEANPHQLFTATMLSGVLGRAGKCEEAEALLRDCYQPDGQPATKLANWPAFYGMNLLVWGQQQMAVGEHGRALSMMEYALNLWGHANGLRTLGYSRRYKATTAYVSARRVDVDMLRAIGVEKDDSWKQPLRPGGQGALYQRLEKEPHTRKFANPYAKRSPLKL